MALWFWYDPALQALHIDKHGVNDREVSEALEDLELEWAGDAGARRAIGRTAEGRHLLVVFRRERTDSFVLTARAPSNAELKAHRRRLRRKPR